MSIMWSRLQLRMRMRLLLRMLLRMHMRGWMSKPNDEQDEFDEQDDVDGQDEIDEQTVMAHDISCNSTAMMTIMTNSFVVDNLYRSEF